MYSAIKLFITTATFLAARLVFDETAAWFAPMLALTYFSAIWHRSNLDALVAPLLAFVVGDVILGLTAISSVVYLNIFGFALLGRYATRFRLLGQYATVFGAITVFDLTTNLAVWYGLGHPAMYPRTMDGLIACYIAAWPFHLAKLHGLLAIGALHAILYPLTKTTAAHRPMSI